MIRVSGVFKVVALRGSAGHHRVDVQHPPDKTVQLIQLVELQVRHLFVVEEERENMDYITEGMWSGEHRMRRDSRGAKKQEPLLQPASTDLQFWTTICPFPILNLRFALFLALLYLRKHL